jgi:hypothetical protein
VWQRLHDDETASLFAKRPMDNSPQPEETRVVEGVNDDMLKMNFTSV